MRVDFTRCTLALRNRRLQQLAKNFLGGVAAEVYGALLQVLEGKERGVCDALPDDEDEDEGNISPVANISEIAEILDPTIDLSITIKDAASRKRMPNGTGKHLKTEHGDEDDDAALLGIKPEAQSDSENESSANGYTAHRDRANRLKLIEKHLFLLEEHMHCFCQRARSHTQNSNEWQVNFPALTSTLAVTELDRTIRSRYGQIPLRIVRMLREKGKLDEKIVASDAMMRIKDVRAILTDLQFRGILEAQELPKDNNRQPSRTLYFWYFDIERVQSLFLQQTYKAMTRTLQRIPVERERFRTAIDKAERSDIKGREEQKLDAVDKQRLREWREVEERLLAQVARMDDMVAILRDFSGWDTSLAT